MRPLPSRLTLRVRAFFSSDWEECVPLRWAGQFAVGAVPGLFILFTIMHMAAQTQTTGQSGSAASIIPLLSASAIADTPAFHRLKTSPSSIALAEVQFRAPRAEAAPTAQRVLTVTKRTSPLRVDFRAPRQQWQHLSASTRSDIDQGLARSRRWERVVLHGTGSTTSAPRLLQRYHSNVQGVPEGMAWHFVIGNGKGAADGSILATDGWQRAIPAASGRDPGTRYTSISVCLAGDFHEQPPTDAQLQALSELMDYFGIKLGHLPLSAHEGARGDLARCLGDKFPLQQIQQAWEADTPPSSAAAVRP